MRRISLIAAACLIAPAAYAHAFLDRAVPAVGSVVSGSPPSISLKYTEAVEPAFSSVRVINDKKEVVNQGKPASKDDGRTLVVTLKPLPPGTYDVEWNVTSVDTHKTGGHFTFTVKP